MTQIQEILDDSASAKDFIDDFIKSDDPRFEGKSKSKRKEMALAAYYAKQRESVEDEEEEGQTLQEALKSKKSYEAMHNYLHTFHNKSISPDVASSIMKHGAGTNDKFHDDYARHALLFSGHLDDNSLDDVSSHIASQKKSTNQLDKNFHKNVNSVGTLRAAVRMGTPDTIADAKKSITADHKHAIFAHGSEEDKKFVLQHGLANKTQLSHSLESGSAGVKEAAINHLRALKDAGSDKHSDLIAKHLPDSKPSFLDRASAKFSSAISGMKQTASDIMAKRAAANAPRKRIAPSFNNAHIMGLNLPKNKALTVENITEDLFDSIATDDLIAAKDQLQTVLSAKVAETLEGMKQQIAQGLFNEKSSCESTSEALEEGMKLVGTHHSDCGTKTAKVYKDSDWDEYRVKHFKNGKHLSDGDYHTSDKDDAHGTAKQFIKESLEEESPEKFAHYFGTKVKGYKVQITDSRQPVGGITLPVDNKAHAKKVAQAHNALPWNF